MSDIAELFAKDPLEYSKQDIDEIIAYNRSKRAQFKAGISPTASKAKPEVKAVANKLDLGSLGL